MPARRVGCCCRDSGAPSVLAQTSTRTWEQCSDVDNASHRYPINSRYRLHPSAPVLLALALTVLLSACIEPLDIVTPRRQWEVNLDSLVATGPFFNAPGDSILAVVDGSSVTFATEVQRSFHNGVRRGAHYVTVKASRHSLKNRDYDAVYLRLAAVRDTGVYAFNGPYSQPK